MKQQNQVTVPSLAQIEAELDRVNYKTRYNTTLRTTIFTLVVVAAAAVLVATLWLPFLRIYGTSMSPTLQDGEIVVCMKTSDFETGDMVAFYYNNKILVKRVIGQAGDWIDMTEDGTVYVNRVAIDEPYVTDKALGECNIELPYQVPDGRVFVMGDHRSTSVDSRSTAVGCVSQEQVLGEIFLRLWPLQEISIFY